MSCSMEKLRIVVGGFIGLLQAGGVTWDYIQYPLGFKILGHDVYYIEDTRLYPIYQKPGSQWDDASSSIIHLQKVMEYFGMKDRWAYRDEASGNCFGLSEKQIKEICSTADVFINVSCSTFIRDEYMKIPTRVLIDSDPMFTQIQYASRQHFTPGESGIDKMIHAHNYLFTFGENIGSEDCLIPITGLNWRSTRQPICLEYWKVKSLAKNNSLMFTTLMNWAAGKKLKFLNNEWGQKDVEFEKFLHLPKRISGAYFSMVMNQTGGTERTFQPEAVKDAGWSVLDPESYAGNWLTYQDFIYQSFAEFSVAKETYVKASTGWFSCRSACYLAAGRPVITQDTGWSKFIPSGEGLFAFNDMETACEAIKQVMADWEKHSFAARSVCEEFFDSRKVLGNLLEQLN